MGKDIGSKGEVIAAKSPFREKLKLELPSTMLRLKRPNSPVFKYMEEEKSTFVRAALLRAKTDEQAIKATARTKKIFFISNPFVG